jgi:hypothetical protein
MTRNWWESLPPAQAEVSCGDKTHRLRWERGKLTALDHPDTEEELVLAALGGDRSECMDLIEAWGSRSDDLEVLAVGPRDTADELAISTGPADGLSSGWVAYAPLNARRSRLAQARRQAALLAQAMGSAGARSQARRRTTVRSGFSAGFAGTGRAGPLFGGRNPARGEAERAWARRKELFSLLVLGPPFQQRLSATVAAAWADGGSRAAGRDSARPALTAALTGRLAPAVRDWLGTDPDLVDATVHEGDGWGRLSVTGRGPGRRLSAALPLTWLASVWAAGLAVTAGHLVVTVTDVSWPEVAVLAVPEPGTDPVPLTVTSTATGWIAKRAEQRAEQ